MAGKRVHLARALMAIGAHRFVSPSPSGSLLILNYHRLRASTTGPASQFDDGVFDTDFETFVAQMRWLKEATHVLDEDELIKARSIGRLPGKRIYSAVTFDDGYIDCLTLVKPVLDSLGIRGIFFTPFEMLESRRLGWWDIAAYLLKRSDREVIKIAGQEYPLARGLAHSLRAILNRFKLEPAERTEVLLSDLSDACGVSPPTIDDQSAELMSWEQVRELLRAGHSVGSHAMSHRVLATLPTPIQRQEIFDSRDRLQAVLARRISSFAYPVGGTAHFTDETVAIVREAGYEQAFTYNTGYSTLPVVDTYRIPRESASSLTVLKAKAWLPRVIKIREHRTA